MDGVGGEVKHAKSAAVKPREEGEISSSDNDDRVNNNDSTNKEEDNNDAHETSIHSAGKSTGTVNRSASAGINLASQLNKTSQGMAIASTSITTSVATQSHTSVKRNSERNSEKNQVPVKSSNPAWHAPSGVNNNLVISFSDNDSGTDSDNEKHEKFEQLKRGTTMVGGNQRPPSLSSAKSSKSQQTARSVNKVIPRKSSFSRTFVSSTTKVDVGGNFRGLGRSIFEQGYIPKNIGANNNLATQEHNFDHGVCLNNTKLRDLRQQIALREKELKLKAALQNKESVDVSVRNYNAMNLSRGTARKADAPSDSGQLQLKEPDRKRLRVSGPISSQPNPTSQKEIPAIKSIARSAEQALENNSRLADKNVANCSQKKSTAKTTELSLVGWRKPDDKCLGVPSRILSGANMHKDCSETERSNMQVDTATVLNQTTPLTQVDKRAFLKNTESGAMYPAKSCGNQHSDSSLMTPVCEHNLKNSCRHFGGTTCGDPSLKSICQTSMDKVSEWNMSMNVAKHGHINMQSLIEVEESLDKGLEEAQDERHRCEIEERNALKAYRKAQRALVEANSRCTELYRKRELHSAQFRSFILNDSSLLWPSRQPEHFSTGLNPVNNLARNVNIVATSSDQMECEQIGYNPARYGSGTQYVNSAPLNASYQTVNGNNLGSDPCTEPDGSTFEPLAHTSKHGAHGISSPANDPLIAGDEDEVTFSVDNSKLQHNIKIQHDKQISLGSLKDTNHLSDQYLSLDDSLDPLTLEENLRSELFARYRGRTLSKNSVLSNIEPADELGTDNDNASEGTQTTSGSGPSSEKDKNQESDIRGNVNPAKTMSESPLLVQKHKKGSLADAEDNSVGGHQLVASALLSPQVLRSAFGHLKVVSSLTSLGSGNIKSKQGNECNDYMKGCGSINSEDIKWGNVIDSLMEDSIGSFTCNIAVDPFLPFCLYELRGKCNNDECPWQHLRDLTDGEHKDSVNTDFQVGVTLREKNTTKCHDVLAPKYLVGLDILKADPHSYRAVVAWKNQQCWLKCFTNCLALSSLLRKDITAGELVLGGDVWIEGSRSCWSAHSSYFHSKGNVNDLNEAASSVEQVLETALLILSQEMHNLEGMKKALSLLSRAIEADPRSEILWIIYLLIFYSNSESVGKDDMFSYAVKHKDKSYGLWLMYINSRMNLDSRLGAFDAALSALCRQAAASERNEIHASACILDLFLQMMNCLCISGDVNSVIQKIDRVSCVLTDSDEPHSLLLSDMLTCLSISDKCMFWVCCVYLAIYRKLPDAVVHQFECEKDLLAIEWPSVHLLEGERQRAVRLMEMAVNSLKSYLSGESPEDSTRQVSVRNFALCHIRCMAALDDLECCQSLLDNYLKLYPHCIELVLIAARLQTNESGGSCCNGFEEALTKWPKEVPGIHCIWNQYIEYAFQKGGPDYAKEIIGRWFDSLSKPQTPQNGIMDSSYAKTSHGSLELASASNPEFLMDTFNQMDIMFGFINLSLAKLLQNDHVESRFAMDKAFKSASLHYIKHCLKEHATFFLTLHKDASIIEQLNILNGYLDDARGFSSTEPLSRQFLKEIEKPKVLQLISNFLSPVSYEASLVNLVLDVWYGPSLLPSKLSKQSELVDFVESILEIVPSNYQLMLSVCKQLSVGYNSSMEGASCSILYWASNSLVSAIFHAVPIAPEYVWVEAAGILGDTAGAELICDQFYKRALSVHPFSMKLWNCYYNLLKTRGDASMVVEAAKEKGIRVG